MSSGTSQSLVEPMTNLCLEDCHRALIGPTLPPYPLRIPLRALVTSPHQKDCEDDMVGLAPSLSPTTKPQGPKTRHPKDCYRNLLEP